MAVPFVYVRARGSYREIGRQIGEAARPQIEASLAWVISDRIAVMYLGKIVEIGETEEVVANPRHPYTKALISVIPVPDPTAKREHTVLTGETPNPADIPSGCRFHPRCPEVMDNCSRQDPADVQVKGSHYAACLRLGGAQ